MSQSSTIFEKHYSDYLSQIANLDFASLNERLGSGADDNRIVLPFFDTSYLVTRQGIVDGSNNKPDYVTCVILAKYLLLYPDKPHIDPEWVSFKDFKRTSHFTNVNYFNSDTEALIAKTFSGRLDALADACEQMRGNLHDLKISYDLSMQFQALPRISLLLLYNDGDEEFPARCSVLFQKHAEYYLDPESLAMTGSVLARGLREAAKPQT